MRLRTLLLLLVFPAALHAASITGIVTNKTTNKPAAGDEVVLINLKQGMQESTRTKTDNRGHFTLDIPDNEIHLVRVTHDKANYFRPAPPGTQSVEIDVFNAAANVEGVSQEADVLRIQTDPSGQGLLVTEIFAVKNDSAPPRTQFSDHAFTFTMPPGAIVDGARALGPGGMPVQSPPVPLSDPGKPNLFAFLFPIRPGETRFQLSYHLPYAGSLTFPLIPQRSIGTLAVLLPRAMTFAPSPGTSFTPVSDEPGVQALIARDVPATQPLSFTVSGAGQLPRDTVVQDGQPNQPGQATQASGPAVGTGDGASGPSVPIQPAGQTSGNSNTPGGGLGTPVDPEAQRDPWAKYKWWMLGGLFIVFAAAAGVLMKRDPLKPNPVTGQNAAQAATLAPVRSQPSSLLASLKEELFTLETERLQGSVSQERYAELKAAFEIVLMHALSRQQSMVSALETSPAASPTPEPAAK